ncbi:hypothetical protein [Coleofasciculus chthonoplastes]|uniref:hypothetical protein n=1 Tax=Coleofasciculus chthonoplastes TaxID=64178 RepID=UPI0032FE808B
MNESLDIEAVRAEALRKLGRNIVNFSKIEAGFKYLLAVSQLEGTGKTVSDQLRKNQNRLRKQTLGKLVQEFNKNILGDASQSEPKPDFFGKGISCSFKVTYDNPDFLKVHKRTLASIVAERNELIHQNLALIDTSSVEDYHNLITLLDEQNPRLLAQLEEMRWMMETLRESWKAFKDLSKSPNFLQSIQSKQ